MDSEKTKKKQKPNKTMSILNFILNDSSLGVHANNDSNHYKQGFYNVIGFDRNLHFKMSDIDSQYVQMR